MRNNAVATKGKVAPMLYFSSKQQFNSTKNTVKNLSSFLLTWSKCLVFDTVNHKLMILVLKKYGFPPKMTRMIEIMYEKFRLNLDKGA